MKIKHLNSYTLKEFKEMVEFGRDEPFNSVVIVPTDNIHDSGFRCMKFILVRNGGIVGAVGGGCDVVNPNGIGNYGRYESSSDFARKITLGMVPYMGISMDCLKRSRCVRIMLSGLYRCDDFIGSNFQFYKAEI